MSAEWTFHKNSPRSVNRKLPAQIPYSSTNFIIDILVAYAAKHLINILSYLIHISLFHTPGGYCRSADSYTTRNHRRFIIKGDGILIQCYPGSIQGCFSILAGNALIPK